MHGDGGTHNLSTAQLVAFEGAPPPLSWEPSAAMPYPSWDQCTAIGARPPFNKHMVEKLCDLVRNRIPPSVALASLGQGEKIVRKWLEQGEADNAAGFATASGFLAFHFAMAQLRVIEEKLEQIESSVAKDEWRKHSWYLERVYPQHFSEGSKAAMQEGARSLINELGEAFKAATPEAASLYNGKGKPLALPKPPK